MVSYEDRESRVISTTVIPTGKEEGVEESLFLPQKITVYGGEGAERLLYADTPQMIYPHADGTIGKDGKAKPPFAVFGEGDAVILDFGEEQNGGVRIFTDIACVGAAVRLRFGESFTECCAELGEKNATNDHAVRDVTLPLSSFSETAFGKTGYRFVRLDFSGNGKIYLKNVYGTCRKLHKKAQYVCPEGGLIGEIYRAAKRTVDLCSVDFVVDGVKRDRLVWVGDMHPETLALTTLYGNCECLERTLDFAREETPLPAWMNAFPTYSLWWIVILADYAPYASNGFMERQKAYFTGLLTSLSAYVSETGQVSLPAYFFDWQTHETPEEVVGVAALFRVAAKKAVALCRLWGISSDLAEDILFRLEQKPLPRSERKQVIAMKYFATGALTEEEKTLLTAGGAKGMSTFMSYYVLHAVASFAPETAVEMMKEYYGDMLSLGATSFWEDFSVEWKSGASTIDRVPAEGEKDVHGDYGAYCYVGFRHSFCHGWATGVLRFLKEQFPMK